MFHLFTNKKSIVKTMDLILLWFALATAAYGALRFCMAELCRRRIKLIYRKTHSSEHIARIVGSVGWANFFRYCILCSGNKILSGTLKAYNREYADGYCYHSWQIAREAHASVKAVGNTFGNIARAATASHTRQKLRNLCIEHNRCSYLKNSCG